MNSDQEHENIKIHEKISSTLPKVIDFFASLGTPSAYLSTHLRLVLVLRVKSRDPVVDVARDRLDNVGEKVLDAKGGGVAAPFMSVYFRRRLSVVGAELGVVGFVGVLVLHELAVLFARVVKLVGRHPENLIPDGDGLVDTG